MEKKFYHSVYLNSEDCVGCFTCLKHCPTNAIRIRNRKAYIIPEFCIDCGECVKRCPHHAKRAYRERFENIIDNYKYTIALPAPAFYSQFNNVSNANLVLTALKLSGFDDVFEVSASAEIVSELTRDYIRNNRDKWPIISTACPTIERLIRIRFPSLIRNMLPILPPMEIAAAMARKKAMLKTGLNAEDIGIIFISPCPSKIAFTEYPFGMKKSNVDHAIAIKDIYPLVLANMKDAERSMESLSHSGRLGKGWATSGGEAQGIQKHEYLAADGIENVIKVLEDLEDMKFLHDLQFIELNSCHAGCVGGALTVENAYLAKAKTDFLCRMEPITRSSTYDLANYEVPVNWDEELVFEPVYRLGDNMFESMTNTEKIDQILQDLPGLDCGCCGSPNCKHLAADIVMRPDFNVSIESCIFLKDEKTEESASKADQETVETNN